MTRSFLVLLALATTAPRACSSDLEDEDPTPVVDPEDADPAVRAADKPAKVTGPPADVGTPGPLSVEVPAKWKDTASALGSAEGAAGAVAAFVKAGKEACPVLRTIALEDGDLSRRGRAIQALTDVKDICADDALLELERVRTLPPLIRTWAAAGRVARAGSIEDLTALASLTGEFPALQRPVGMRADALLGPKVPADQLLTLATDAPSLAGAVLPLLRARPTTELLDVQFTHAQDPIRRQAAAYLGTFVGEEPARAKDVIGAYAYTKGAKKPFWAGGALYVPAARWDKDQARSLYRNLLSWQIFCEEEGLDGEKRQLNNNLRSVGIWRVAGYSRYNPDTFAAVAAYGKDEGPEALESLLKEHGLQNDPRYRKPMQVTR